MSELHGNIGPTRNYENLTNLPSINDVRVVGSLTPSDLGLADDASVEEIRSALENKVDKVTGKGLSENDYTDGEKAKLEGIEAGAEKNVQSDWDASDGSDAFIKNKPSVLETVTIRGTATTKSGTNTDLDVYKTAEVDSAIDTLDNKIDTNVADLDERKAEIDGYYETFTSGQTNQLIATEAITDTEPYIYRKTGSPNDVGDRVYDTIVGGSVVWNQLIKSTLSPSAAGGVVSFADGVASFTASTKSGNVYWVARRDAGHKYLAICDIKGTTAVTDGTVCFYDYGRGKPIDVTTSWSRAACLLNPTQTTYSSYRYGVCDYRESGWDTIKVKNYMLIDLTAAVTPTIADYVYTLETATAGAGVAWVRRYFTKEYFEFCEPHFEHVQTSAKCTVGFNQWDEETANGYWDRNTGEWVASGNWASCKNYVPCLPNTGYYFKTGQNPSGSLGAICFYDYDKNFISSINSGWGDRVNTTPNNAHYMTFYANQGYFKNNICINIHGDRDGEYEPYKKRTYPIEPKVLRGVPKLDSANRLYFDGDVYQHDGTISRRINQLRLNDQSANLIAYPGQETEWAYIVGFFPTNALPKYQNTTPYWGVATNMECVQNVSTSGKTGVLSTSPSNGGKNIYLAYPSGITSLADFKTWLNTHTVDIEYIVAEPTTETAEPYQSPMVVDPLGTEQFIDYGVEEGDRDVAIPVGINSSYPQDLRGKLQRLPSPTGTNGDYVITEVDGKLYLKPYVPAVGLTAPTPTEGEGE